MELQVKEYELPSAITFNYEELKSNLIEKCHHYETIVYTDADVIDSFVLSDMSIYQGSKIINGLLYAPVGYGTSEFPGYLKIVNIE